MNKKIFTTLVLGSILLISSGVLAQQALPVPDPDVFESAQLCGAGVPIQQCILNVFQIVFRALIWISGALAVIMFLWAGLTYIAKGENATEAKGRLIWGAVGLIIALVSFIIVTILAKFAETGQLQ